MRDTSRYYISDMLGADASKRCGQHGGWGAAASGKETKDVDGTIQRGPSLGSEFVAMQEECDQGVALRARG